MSMQGGSGQVLPGLPTPPSWTCDAACLGWTDLDWIDPEPDQAQLCRVICAGCPVRAQCLTAALASGEPWGIWGGQDPAQRADIAEASGFPVPTVVPCHGVHARYVHHHCRCAACRRSHAAYERQRRRSKSPAA